jgi:hypothetical protein
MSASISLVTANISMQGMLLKLAGACNLQPKKNSTTQMMTAILWHTKPMTMSLRLLSFACKTPITIYVVQRSGKDMTF